MRHRHPFLPNGLCHPYESDTFVSSFRDVMRPFFSFLFYFFIKKKKKKKKILITASIQNPNQTPRSVAYDLGLQCLPMSLKGTLGTNGLNESIFEPR